MISDKTIEEVITSLVKLARPQKVILFGSYARGDAGEQSDLDFLVVQKEVKDRRREMVHLQDILRPMRIPVEVLVVSESKFSEWEDVPGAVFHEAKREGILCYDGKDLI